MLEPESIKKPVFLIVVDVPVPTANTVCAVLALLPSIALYLPTNVEPNVSACALAELALTINPVPNILA